MFILNLFQLEQWQHNMKYLPCQIVYLRQFPCWPSRLKVTWQYNYQRHLTFHVIEDLHSRFQVLHADSLFSSSCCKESCNGMTEFPKWK